MNHGLNPQSAMSLAKAPTGIHGLDEITGGGLPEGRPTLVCGSAGCGKTLFAIEFLVHGALQYSEPGVLVTFEETAEELTQNVRSLDLKLNDLIAQEKLLIDHIQLDHDQFQESGDYNLEGLFVRLELAIQTIGAKRVAVDTLEALFASFSHTTMLRSELHRLMRWLKTKGVTAVITAEQGNGDLTRHGLEEYVSDCVICLDHRTDHEIATRRLRVVKYRGSGHGLNEYPFLIDEHGISVMPITSLGLDHPASAERISSGIGDLDYTLGGQSYYRGSTILLSGTAGTGKTSIAAHFVEAACQRGERSLYFAFEESPQQIMRNMASIGLDLAKWVKTGHLKIYATRPAIYGLEMHLVNMHKCICTFEPNVIIVDPITSLMASGSLSQVNAMLTRLIDFLKSQGVTALFTSLTSGRAGEVEQDVGTSTLMDTWLLLSILETNGERNRGLYILKSRGMDHSNQIREFRLTNQGIELVEVYIGPEGVLTGSARLAQELQENNEALRRRQEIDRRQEQLNQQREIIQARIAILQADLVRKEAELQQVTSSQEAWEQMLRENRNNLIQVRQSELSLPQIKIPELKEQGHAYESPT